MRCGITLADKSVQHESGKHIKNSVLMTLLTEKNLMNCTRLTTSVLVLSVMVMMKLISDTAQAVFSSLWHMSRDY